MYGFDYDWWAEWSPRQEGPSRGPLAPTSSAPASPSGTSTCCCGASCPAGLFARASRGRRRPRDPRRGRALLAAAGLPDRRPPRRLPRAAGRLDPPRPRARLRLLLRPDPPGEPPRPRRGGLVFALNAPFARWVDGLARRGRLGADRARARRSAATPCSSLALVLVHMVSSHAKVLVVREERLSAALAFLSSLGFCARNLAAVLGQYLAVGAAGGAAPRSSSAPSTPGSPSSAGRPSSWPSSSSRPWSPPASRSAWGSSPPSWSCSRRGGGERGR